MIGPFALAGNKKIAYLCGNEVQSLVYKLSVVTFVVSLVGFELPGFQMIYKIFVAPNVGSR